jgi:hypothetical protein
MQQAAGARLTKPACERIRLETIVQSHSKQAVY